MAEDDDDDDDDVQIPQPLHYVNLSLCEKLIFRETFLHFNYYREGTAHVKECFFCSLTHSHSDR